MNPEPAMFDRTTQLAHIWLNDISAGIDDDKQHSYRALMAVLHAVRDRLDINISAQFSAQMPVMVKGIYFHNWDPQKEKVKKRSQKDFLDDVEKAMDGITSIEPKTACTAVFHTLQRHMDEGVLEQVKEALPKTVRSLWPEKDEAGDNVSQTTSHPESQSQDTKEDTMAQHYRENDQNRSRYGRDRDNDQSRFMTGSRDWEDERDDSERYYSDQRRDWTQDRDHDWDRQQRNMGRSDRTYNPYDEDRGDYSGQNRYSGSYGDNDRDYDSSNSGSRGRGYRRYAGGSDQRSFGQDQNQRDYDWDDQGSYRDNGRSGYNMGQNRDYNRGYDRDQDERNFGRSQQGGRNYRGGQRQNGGYRAGGGWRDWDEGGRNMSGNRQSYGYDDNNRR